MTKNLTLIICAMLAFASCSKESNNITPAPAATPKMKNGSSGSGSGSGGGSTSSTGLIQNVLASSAYRMVATHTDSFFVSFTQPVPAGGITLNITSSNPAVQVPATLFVPAGAVSVYPVITTSSIASTVTATLSVSYAGQTKSTSISVFPLTYNFPAPSLQSPGNGAKFKNRIQVTFQVSTNVNAYYTDIQISDDIAFPNPMLEFYTTNGIVPASYFNGTGIRYWRARYIDGSGNGGPWSSIRTFEIEP